MDGVMQPNIGTVRSQTTDVSVRGQRLRVVTQGSGPPLLLITGLGANIEMWSPLLQRLPDRRVIAFDPPGAGRSPVGRPRRIPDYADVARDLLDELEIDCADVLGYSWGGAVAQQLAHDHPDRVRRLILAGTMCGVGSVPAPPQVLVHLVHPLRYYSKCYLKMVAPKIYGGRSAVDEGIVRQQGDVREASPPSLLGYATQVSAITGWSSLPWLHKLRAETLVLHGQEDPIVRVANGELLARRIPRAELRVINGAGHLFLFDQPDDAVPLLEEFLSK
jgi:poly(3-hydroxyalkanoate) depolymerase